MNAASFRYRPVAASRGAPELHDNGALPSGMFLSFTEQWNCIDSVVFLKELAERLIARLPLSISRDLAAEACHVDGLRRDLSGVLGFARQLHALSGDGSTSQEPAWRALCAGTVCTGISVALAGVVASMRSHAGFAAHDAFDFPAEWNVAASASGGSSAELSAPEKIEIAKRQRTRVGLVDQLRTVVRHLGHRLRRESDSQDRLSDDLYGRLESVVRRVAQAEYAYEQFDEVLDWPFECLSKQALDLLELELLEATATLVRQLDTELGFELVLASEASYGYNAQTRRFVDSRSGSWEATPWMITQFPRVAKHIEEVVVDGRVQRVWSEVYDRSSGRLLSVSALGEPFASIALNKGTAEQRGSSGSPQPVEQQSDLPVITQAAPELPVEEGGERRPDPQSLEDAALDVRAT